MANGFVLVTLVAGNIVSQVNFATLDECAETKRRLIEANTHTVEMACIAGNQHLTPDEVSAMLTSMMKQMNELILKAKSESNK